MNAKTPLHSQNSRPRSAWERPGPLAVLRGKEALIRLLFVRDHDSAWLGTVPARDEPISIPRGFASAHYHIRHRARRGAHFRGIARTFGVITTSTVTFSPVFTLLLQISCPHVVHSLSGFLIVSFIKPL